MNGTETATPGTGTHRLAFSGLLILFLSALAIRVVYPLILFATMGLSGLTGEDSSGFIRIAKEFAGAVETGSVAGWGWLGPELVLMPLFTWFLTGAYLLAGEHAPWVFVVLNGVADSVTALLVAGIAWRIRPGYALAAGWFYALTPTTIVLSGFVYTDTLFVFAAVLSIWGFLRWQQRRTMSTAIGFAVPLAAATMIRAVIAPWVVVIFLIGGVVAVFSTGRRGQSFGQLAVAGLIALLIVAPVPVRNYVQHDAIAFTPQNGRHWLYWTVPFVQQTADGSVREDTLKRLRQHPDLQALKKEKSPFRQSDRLTALALKELQRLGITNAAKTWGVGAAINLAVPAVSIAPPARTLQRPSYYGTAGQGTFGKVQKYLEAAHRSLYGQLLILGFLGLVLFRLVQIIGLIACFRAAKGVTLLLVVWCLYFLFISGPIASPKYRLPLEPPLAVFAGAGWIVLRRRKDRPEARQSAAVPA